jgi:hypothetical protein
MECVGRPNLHKEEMGANIWRELGYSYELKHYLLKISTSGGYRPKRYPPLVDIDRKDIHLWWI